MKRNTPHRLTPDIRRNLENLQDFIVVDVETTGFDARTNRVIEIGMLKVVNGKEIESFSSFINPGIPIPPHITDLTGIKDVDVQSAPTFDEIVVDIATFMGDGIIVGHNVQFDIRFMVAEFARCGIRRDYHYADTLFLAKSMFPELKSYKLSTLINYLGFEETQSHRALDDARCTLKILSFIRNRITTLPLDEAINRCCNYKDNCREDSRIVIASEER